MSTILGTAKPPPADKPCTCHRMHHHIEAMACRLTGRPPPEPPMSSPQEADPPVVQLEAIDTPLPEDAPWALRYGKLVNPETGVIQGLEQRRKLAHQRQLAQQRKPAFRPRPMPSKGDFRTFTTTRNPSLKELIQRSDQGQWSLRSRATPSNADFRTTMSTYTPDNKKKNACFLNADDNETDSSVAGSDLDEPSFLTRRRRKAHNIIKTAKFATNFMDPGDVNMKDVSNIPASDETSGVNIPPLQPLHCLQPLQSQQPQPPQPVQAPQEHQRQDGFAGSNDQNQGFGRATANNANESLWERLNNMSLANYPHLNLHLPEIIQAISNIGRRNWSSPTIMHDLAIFPKPVDSELAVIHHSDVLDLLLRMGIRDAAEQWRIKNMFRHSPEIFLTIRNFFRTALCEVHCHPADPNYYDQLLWHKLILSTQAESIRNAISKYANGNFKGLARAFKNKLAEVIALQEKVQRLIDSYELSQQIPVTVVPEVEMKDCEPRKESRPFHDRNKNKEDQREKQQLGKRRRRDSDADDRHPHKKRDQKGHYQKKERSRSEGHSYDEDNRREKRGFEGKRKSPSEERDDHYEKHERNQKKRKQERNRKGGPENNERARPKGHNEKKHKGKHRHYR